MRTIAIACLGPALAACSVPTPNDIMQSSALAGPSIVYKSGNAIGVDYREGGILHTTRQREAIALIEQYCKGQYRVIRRDGGHIDALCVR